MNAGAAVAQDNAEKEEIEMNELVDSDPENYGADTEEIVNRVKKGKNSNAKEELKNQIKNYLSDLNKPDAKIPSGDQGILTGDKADDQKIFEDLFDTDLISLEDPEESRINHKTRKETDAKINNSFTGPYPTDPTEFGHTDTGENYQFTTVAKGWR